MQDNVATVSDHDILNEDGTSNLMTIILIPYGAELMHTPTLSTRQIVCSPTIETRKEGPLYKTLRTPATMFDLAQLLCVLPPEQTPEIIIVWADSSMTMFPINLGAFKNCRSLLMVGDTHHQKMALQNMMTYAANNPFDAILFMFRQHTHFFREAGFQNVHWIQGQMTFPDVRTIASERRREIVLLGSRGDQHPQRRRIIDMIEAADYPLLTGSYPHEAAMRLYSEVQISLNVSLNGDMNWRPFEVMGAGGFLITDRLSHFSGMDILFEEGIHYISFSTVPELMAKLDHYLDHPEECLAIARHGQEHYLKHFSRDRITRGIWERLLYNRSADIFHVSEDERLSVSYKNGTQILPRIALYETIQECQRIEEKPRILFLPDAEPVLISDCADLPRVEIFIQSDNYMPITDLDTVAKYKKMTYVHGDDALKQEWDILVAGYTGDARALAETYNAKTIAISGRPWTVDQKPLSEECPTNYTSSLNGYAIFAKNPTIYLNSLSNHYPVFGQFIVDAAMSIGLRDKRVIEIGDCIPEDLAKAVAVKSWLGFAGGSEERAMVQSLEAVPDQAKFRARIMDLPPSLHGQFDLVCLFQGMERIDYFQQMLEATYAALRQSGKFYFIIDPLWSSHDGHALPEIVDAAGRVFSREDSGIPPWGHLLMSEDELGTHLSQHTDALTVEKILEHIYRSPNLNRMFAEDYASCIHKLPFKAGTAQSIRDVEVPAETLSALTKKYPGYSRFGHCALKYDLRK